jgi:LysM repeat protein
MKHFTLSFLLVLLSSISAVGQSVIDTIQSDKGPILLYSNRTWEYLKDKGFNGVLNTRLHKMLSEDTVYRFVQRWNNDVCFTSKGNDLSRLKDTIWLCVQDSVHTDFYSPVPGPVTSRYGYRNGRYHNGIDLDLETGDTVRSCWSGKVRYSRYNDGGFGYLVVVRHYNGLETFYAHLSKLLVVPDQDVEAGDPIGLGGNTGRSYGSHLHFEVRLYDDPINPEEVIDFEEMETKDENLLVHRGLFRPGAKPSDQMEFESAPATPVVTQNRVYYKVRSGDTLSAIAARNRTTVSKICQLNGIKPSTTLQIGRSLRVR